MDVVEDKVVGVGRCGGGCGGMGVGEERVVGGGGGVGALPGWVGSANWFQGLNALSWQITLGAPAYLYAKSLGASATVIGVMAALTPLLTVTQLPATKL